MNHAAAPPAAFTPSLPAESVPPPARRAQRVRRTPAQKAELIARFEASGLKLAAMWRPRPGELRQARRRGRRALRLHRLAAEPLCLGGFPS